MVPGEPAQLKQWLTLFDKIHVVGPEARPLPAELELLVGKGCVELTPADKLHGLVERALLKRKQPDEPRPVGFAERMRSFFDSLLGEEAVQDLGVPREDPEQLLDFSLRLLAVDLEKASMIETVPVCRHDFPTELGFPGAGRPAQRAMKFRISVLAPADSCPWERVLDFRDSSASEGLRDFLWWFVRAKVGYRAMNDGLPNRLMGVDYQMDAIGMSREYFEVRGFSNPEPAKLDELVKELPARDWGELATVELLDEEADPPSRPCCYLTLNKKA
jgi:hypothetical protein